MKRSFSSFLTSVVVISSVCLAVSSHAFGQEHERFEGWCDKLVQASSAQLVQFLDNTTNAAKDPRCVTWTIHQLGKERYNPAITPLVHLLDFRRPQNDTQEAFEGIPREVFPAEEALELIGKEALPEILRALKSSTSSDIRQHALNVWMEIYRQSGKHVLGVAGLRQEEAKATDVTVKQRLDWALGKAIAVCNPDERKECEHAAESRTP